MKESTLDLSFVVIGFNEAENLQACIASCRDADTSGLTTEIIYVDGGSSDDSKAIAESAGADRVLGEAGPRRAAENRNVGLAAAQGEYVQFVDGDMVLDPDWPKAALKVLGEHRDVGVVSGQLREVNQNAFYRALQIDWHCEEGVTDYCGGAAIFRREVIAAAGGFPEDVKYGEEPLLCWRLRNEQGAKVYHIHHIMAQHDLAYTGFFDYWRRNIRVGESYAEISHRCKGTDDPFWSRETRQQIRWGISLIAIVVGLVALPALGKMILLAGTAALLMRKAIHALASGNSLSVAAVYAIHTYMAKFGISYGVLKWYVTRS